MELIFSIILAAILVFLLGAAFRIPSRTVGTDTLRAGGFPTGVIVLALVVLVILTAQYIARAKKAGRVFDGQGIHRKVLTAIGAIGIYAALMNFIGFILATLLFTFANPLIMGYRKYRILAVFSVVLTVLIVLVFGKFFFIPLPRGLGFLRELSYYVY
jgi:hypothetical protein